MSAARDALIIGSRSDTSRVAALCEELQKLDLRLVRCAQVSEVPASLQAAPHLALVVLDDDAARLGGEILETIRARDRRVPLLWITKDAASLKMGARPLESLVPPGADVVSTGLSLLRDYAFPAVIRDGLLECTSLVLKEGFQTNANADPSYLRLPRQGMAPLTATLTFTSPKVEGCLSLSGAPAFFESLHQRILPNAPKRANHAQEALRELMNQLAARFRDILLRYGADLRAGFPVLSEDPTLSLTYRPGRIALTQRWRAVAGELFSELCLDKLDMQILGREVSVELLKPGTMSFF